MTIIDFFKNSVEWQSWGCNLLTFSFIMTAFFTLVQAYGIYRQAHEVWHKKKAASVSEYMFSYGCAFFISFFIYGFYKNSLAICINSLLCLPYFQLLTGIWKFKKITLRGWLFTGLMPLMVILMILMTDKDTYILIILLGNIIGAIMQGAEIIRDEDRGNLRLELILSFLISNIFWLIFGIVTENWVFEIFNSIALLLYVIGLWLYFKYPPQPRVDRRHY